MIAMLTLMALSWHYLKPRNASQHHKTRAAESLAL